MKRNLLKNIGTAVLTFFVVLVLSPALAFAQEKLDELELETNYKNNNSGGGLDGTWEVVVTERNCQTNVPIRNHPSLNTFMFGGTMMNTSAAAPPSRRTTGQGVWSHVRGNTYTFSVKSFNFDANNNFVGWVIIRQHVTVYGDLYFSSGRGEVYDANGNLIFTGCSTTTGTRYM